MKTVNQVVSYAKANPEEVTALAGVAGSIIGGAIGLSVRKKMYDAGMIKSFWFPCLIKKAGTYRRQSDVK